MEEAKRRFEELADKLNGLKHLSREKFIEWVKNHPVPDRL